MQIQISNLKKCFGEKTAVDIANFTVNNGEIVGLVGNNGAGKTTLFRLMLDLLKADEGSVTLLPKLTDAGTGMPEQINPALSENWKTMTGLYRPKLPYRLPFCRRVLRVYCQDFGHIQGGLGRTP